MDIYAFNEILSFLYFTVFLSNQVAVEISMWCLDKLMSNNLIQCNVVSLSLITVINSILSSAICMPAHHTYANVILVVFSLFYINPSYYSSEIRCLSKF